MAGRYVTAAEHVFYLPVLEGPEHALYVIRGTIVRSVDMQVRHDAERITWQKRHDLPVAMHHLKRNWILNAHIFSTLSPAEGRKLLNHFLD